MLNPIQGVTNIASQIHIHSRTPSSATRSGSSHQADEVQLELEAEFVDLTIQFIGASHLPQIDVIGTTDPFFHAHLDQAISYRSSVQRNTLNPVWNANWQVKNVPTTATLSVVVMDKDHRVFMDNYIGKFETTISPGAKEVELRAPLHVRSRGTFWLKIDSTPSCDEQPWRFPYLFDGPVHYSHHSSLSVGTFTHLSDSRLYSTWKVYIKGVPRVFDGQVQHWNRNYKAAQTIFSKTPMAAAVRSSIHAVHRLLYMRAVSNTFGVVKTAEDASRLFRGGYMQRSSTIDGRPSYTHRIKPAVYTYVISTDDDSLRFSETGAAFFVDFASKHALHSNCAEAVWYSGELHPRPVGGWARFSEVVEEEETKWELVIDNNSGTYSPDPGLLPKVKEIVEMNFPGFGVVALRYDDPELKTSTDACKAYARKGMMREHEEKNGDSLNRVTTV